RVRTIRLLPPQCQRPATIYLAEDRIEAPHTAVTRGKAHICHRQRGFADQLLGKMQALGAGYGQWRNAKVLPKQPGELTGTNAQAGRELRRGPLGQPPGSDQLQGPGYRVGRAQPRWSARGRFRPATQTGPESGLRSGGGAPEQADVFLARNTYGTDRSAVNAGGQHADENAAIEMGIPCLTGLFEIIGVEVHGDAAQLLNCSTTTGSAAKLAQVAV